MTYIFGNPVKRIHVPVFGSDLDYVKPLNDPLGHHTVYHQVRGKEDTDEHSAKSLFVEESITSSSESVVSDDDDSELFVQDFEHTENRPVAQCVPQVASPSYPITEPSSALFMNQPEPEKNHKGSIRANARKRDFPSHGVQPRGKTFDSLQLKRVLLEKSLKRKSNGQFECIHCKAMYDSEQSIRIHILLSRQRVCTGCSSKYCNNQLLIQHQKADKIRCESCSKVFCTKDSYEKHLTCCGASSLGTKQHPIEIF